MPNAPNGAGSSPTVRGCDGRISSQELPSGQDCGIGPRLIRESPLWSKPCTSLLRAALDARADEKCQIGWRGRGLAEALESCWLPSPDVRLWLIAIFTMNLQIIRARLSGWRSAIQLSFPWLVSHRHVFLERLNFGIATRLVAAFVGVGILVLAANVFVVKGVLIEKPPEITRVAPAPMPPVAAAPVRETEPVAI